MLKNRYQEILVGMGPISLIRGIISLKRKRSTLLIDDKRFSTESYPGLFLSELEVLALIRLGKRYEIPELLDLHQFLIPADLNFITDERRLKLGKSPLLNIKEVLRKYPELLDWSDLDQVYHEHAEDFDKVFLEELNRFESLCFEASLKQKAIRFELQGPEWLKTIYRRFRELVNKEYTSSHDLKYAALLHLLGLGAEEKLKTSLSANEIPYYFFRLFSPIYRLHDFFLTTQLKRRLTLLEGDYKESSIQFWQMHQNKFENLLLASFEGVISGERVLFFSHLPYEVPFELKGPYAIYRKTQMGPQKRVTAPFPPSSISLITTNGLLGGERPYRVLTEGGESMTYDWPYPELPGSKPEFYDKALRESYKNDSLTLPFTYPDAGPSYSGSATLDLRPLRSRGREDSVLSELGLEIAQKDGPIKGFEYWGPFRYKSLGLLALFYGIERN